MAATSEASEQASIDWRRLAADRNIAPAVAQGLWERAKGMAADEPARAEQLYNRFLEEAAAADATPAVGKQTLVDAKGPSDPASLGPGKMTRVIDEQKAPAPGAKKDKDAAASAAGPAPAAPVPGGDATADAAKKGDKKTPEGLRAEISNAVKAGQSAAAMIAGADASTIVAALRELKATEGADVVQKLMGAAGDAIERILGAQAPDADAKAAEPVGADVKIDTGTEQHTQFSNAEGEPMMASTPRPVSQRIEDWKRYVSEQPPAVQAKVAGEIARATQLTTTVADLTKKAKAGDAAAKSQLATAQQQLATSISTIGKQIPPEPEKKPGPPPLPPTAAAPPPLPGGKPPPAGAMPPPLPGQAGRPPAPGQAVPPAPGAAPAAPVVKPPPDPAAVKMADTQLLGMFRLTGNKVPVALTSLGDQERVDESAKPAADLRRQHYPTYESLLPELGATATEKSTQLDAELGLEKGAEALPAAFKQQVHDAFVADTYPAAAIFEQVFVSVVKAGPYMMRGKPLSAADFDAAVPSEQSLSRVINIDATFPTFINKTDAEAAFVAKFPGITPTSEELTAFVLQEAQGNASAAVKSFISPKIVDGPGWMFPEPDIRSDAVFPQYCDLLGLYAGWAPRGHLRMTVKRSAMSAKIAAQQLRKPTVFDGMQSPLWMQRNNRDHNWGKTSGGIRQALMKVEFADVDPGKWMLTAADPKHAALIAAVKAKAAKKATPAQAKLVADEQKALLAKTATAQAAQRADDAKPPPLPGAAPATPPPLPPKAPAVPPPLPAAAKNDNHADDDHDAAVPAAPVKPTAPPPATPPPLPVAPKETPAAPPVPVAVAPPLPATPPPLPPKAPAVDPKMAAPPPAKDAAAPAGAPQTNAPAPIAGGKDPGKAPTGPEKPPATPPPLPKKDPVEEQLENFVKDELAVLSGKNFAGATKVTVAGLINDLGAFELGLEKHIGKFAKNPSVAEAKGFLSDKRSALEDAAHMQLALKVLGKTAAPKLEPATFKELSALKSEISPWLTAFKNDPAFVSGVANCNELINEVDKALGLILTHRDKLLRDAKTAIISVDVNNPGTAIADAIAPVQIWLDAILLPDPGVLRGGVLNAKTLKEGAIRKAVEEKAAAEAAKAAAAKPVDTKDAKDGKTPAPETKPEEKKDAKTEAKAPAPVAPAPEPEAKQLTDQEKALLQQEKYNLELKVVEEELARMMENALKGAEIFNAAGATALSVAVIAAHLAPMIAIPAALGKAGLMFFTKYSKKKGFLAAKNQLLMLSPEQIHELVELFATDLYSFKNALREVNNAAQVAKFQTGAGTATVKKEAAPLAVDAVEVGTALSGIHEGVVHFMHLGASVMGPIVAGIQLGQTFAHAKHHAHHIHQLKEQIAKIDAVLGKPSPPPAPALPAPAGEAVVFPPVPPEFLAMVKAPPAPPKPVAPLAAPAAPGTSVAPPPAPGAETKSDKPPEPEKEAAEPIVETLTMAGAPHQLIADPKTGKIEHHSIADSIVAKLQSILNIVPEGMRMKVADALSFAADAVADVIDPGLKAGAQPSERPAVLKRLGSKLKALAAKIRSIGDTGKLKDLTPDHAKRAKDEEAALEQKVAQPPAAPATPVKADPKADAKADATTPLTAKADPATKPDAKSDAPATPGKDPAAPAKDPAAPPPAAPEAKDAKDPKDSKDPKDAKDPALTPTPPTPGKDPAAPGKDPAAPGKDPAAPGKDPAAPAPDANAEAPGKMPPEDKGAYFEHLKDVFKADVAELDRLHTEFKKQDTAVAHATQKLKLTAEEVKATADALEAVKKKFEGIGTLSVAQVDELEVLEEKLASQQAVQKANLVGKTMPQLFEEAKKEKEALAAKEVKTKDDVKKIEAIMHASILLGAQIDEKSAATARGLYAIKIDQVENPRLVKLAEKAKATPTQVAELAVGYRNWGKEWIRVDIMRDENHRQILFIRDLLKYGDENGMTVKMVRDKIIGRLGLDAAVTEACQKEPPDFSGLTKDNWEVINQKMRESAAKANRSVTAAAGVKKDPPVPPTPPTPPTPPPPPPPGADQSAKAKSETPAPPAGGKSEAPPTDAKFDAKADTKADAKTDTKAETKTDAPKVEPPAAKVEPPTEKPPGSVQPVAPTTPPGQDKAPPPGGKDAAPPASPTVDPKAVDPKAVDPKAVDPKAPGTPPALMTAAPPGAQKTADPTTTPTTPVAPTTPPVDPGKDPAAPAAPAHTPAQSEMELASITSATIPQAKGEPPAKLTLDAGAELVDMTHKSDSPDPIRLKDELITLTKNYLKLDKLDPVPAVDDPKRLKALADIKAKFAALREAMAYARGEDSQLTNVRTQFEKFIGAKATSNAWPEGHNGLNKMCTQAKLMIVESKSTEMVNAKTVDAALASLKAQDPGWAEALGIKLGTNINIGFAGAVGKEFDQVIAALTNGSMVQKAMTLIVFSEKFMTPAVLGNTPAAMKRITDNITATQAAAKEDLAKFKLDERRGLTGGAKNHKQLLSAPFLDTMDGKLQNDGKRAGDGLKGQNAGLDGVRANQPEGALKNIKMGGEMDSKTPQQPVELLDEAQLDFLSTQGEPKVDFTDANAIPGADERKAAKVAALKKAGIHLSKAPGLIEGTKNVFPAFGEGAPAGAKVDMETAGHVDATSIVKDNDRAVDERTTVANNDGKAQTYIEGKAENIVDPMHAWINQARMAHAPLKAGISGTTARFAGAAQLLGATKHEAVVAMIGHLQAIEAHSFWEIVAGAGLGMQPGKYVPFAPNDDGMRAAGAEFTKTRVHNLGDDDIAKKTKVILGE